jgi:hypothetical protein
MAGTQGERSDAVFDGYVGHDMERVAELAFR